MSFLIKDAMTKNVVVIDPEDSIKKVVKLFSTKHIGCLIIMDKEKIAGILTERDFLKRVAIPNLDKNIMVKMVMKMKVKEIMTKNVITLDSEKTVEDAVDLLEKRGIKKLPITENGKLVGIVTRTDLLKVMRKVEEEQSEKMRKVCEELHNAKIELQTKISELEKKYKRTNKLTGNYLIL